MADSPYHETTSAKVIGGGTVRNPMINGRRRPLMCPGLAEFGDDSKRCADAKDALDTDASSSMIDVNLRGGLVGIAAAMPTFQSHSQRGPSTMWRSSAMGTVVPFAWTAVTESCHSPSNQTAAVGESAAGPNRAS